MIESIFIDPTLGTGKPAGNLVQEVVGPYSKYDWDDRKLLAAKGIAKIRENKVSKGIGLTVEGASFVLGRANSSRPPMGHELTEAENRVRKHFFCVLEKETVSRTRIMEFVKLGIRRFLILDSTGSVIIRPNQDLEIRIIGGSFGRITLPDRSSMKVHGCRIGRMDLLSSETGINLTGGIIDQFRVHSPSYFARGLTVRDLLVMDTERSKAILSLISLSYSDPRKGVRKIISAERRSRSMATYRFLSGFTSMESNADAIDQYYQFYRSRSHWLRRVLFWYNEAHHAIWKPLGGLLIFAGVSALLIFFDIKLDIDGLEPESTLPPLSYVAHIPRLFSDIALRGFPPSDWGYILSPSYWFRGLLKLGIIGAEGLAAYSLFSFLAGLKKRFGYKKLG